MHTTICFVAGHSGGHIIPALTRAQQFKDQGRAQEILFFSTTATLDSSLVKDHPAITQLVQLPLENVPYKKWWRLPLFIIKCFTSFGTSFYYLMKKKPARIISMGGFVSVPVCLAGTRLKVLGLKNNKISTINDNAFVNAFLQILYLENNALKDPPIQALIRLPNLRFVGVRNNPLSRGDIKAFKKELKHVEISTSRVTRTQLLKLGIAAATAAIAVVVAIGIRHLAKYKSPVELAIEAEAMALANEKEGKLGEAKALWLQAQTHWQEAARVWQQLSEREKVGEREPAQKAEDAQRQAHRIGDIGSENELPSKAFQAAELLEAKATKAVLFATTAVADRNWQEAQRQWVLALNYWTKAQTAWRKLKETRKEDYASVRAEEAERFINEATIKLREARQAKK